MRRWILTVFIFFAFVIPAQAPARSIHGAASTFTSEWKPLSIGAGGQITGIRNYPDGTTLIRTDTYGGYLYSTSASCSSGAAVYAAPCWKLLVKASNIPSFNIDIAFGTGLVEFVAAPSNTNVLYMLWQGFLYVSLDKGTTWAKTTQTTSIGANDGNASGPWIAVDPNDPATAFISSGSSVVKTTNGTSGASATFSAVASIGGSAVLVYEQGSSTHILAARIGAGVYESTNGSTFSLTTSSHTSTKPQLVVDKFAQFWLTDNGGSNLFKYASGAWSTISSPGGMTQIAVLAADPNSASLGANHIVVTNFAGQPNESKDNGATWSETTRTLPQTVSASGAQPAWLGNAYQGTPPFLNVYSIVFDQSSNLLAAGGLGVWQTNAPLVANGTPWAANSLGIEQLVANQVISSAGNSPSTAVWDKGCFKNTNPDVFPPNYWSSSASLNPIMGGWGIDWASSDTNFYTCLEYSNINAAVASASSTDGGNNYTLWGALPTLPARQGGRIAALDSTHWLTAPDVNAPLYFTANGGGSWTQSTITGTPTNWMGAFNVGQPIAADRVAAGTFCAVTGGQVFYASINSGANFAPTGLTSANVDGSPNQFFLKSVPGQSGHYFYTAGFQGGSHPANVHLWKITKTTTACDTATSCNVNLKEPVVFGFGAIKPGASYPTIYTIAWFNGVYGIYQSTDACVNWTAINVPASQTPWPLDHADFPVTMEGDADIYGRPMVGFHGSGFAYIDTQDACPWIGFTNIVPNQALTGAAVTLTAVHSGLDPSNTSVVPVTGVAFYLDGVQIGTTQTGQTSYSVSLNASAQTPGAHTLKVQASGNGCTLGGTGNSKSIPVTTS